jgi:hypothetical protein
MLMLMCLLYHNNNNKKLYCPLRHCATAVLALHGTQRSRRRRSISEVAAHHQKFRSLVS